MSAAPDVCALSAHELLAAYRDRSLSPVEVVDALVARCAEHDGELGAFTTLCAERARAEAAASERAHADGTAEGALAGVPFAVKDLFDTAGVRTTYGSPMFADHVPGEDAVAVARVRAAGAVLLGKAQTHEFAWGISSVNELMGSSRNPWRPERVSGGSSGGSAVALAARLVPLAIGSDTGGSIRVPSAFCGTVGFKPTYGRVSTAGVWPLAPSLDHPGPMARTAADAALLLDVLDDPAREGGSSVPGDEGLAGRRVGICPDLHLVPLTPAVQSAFDAALATLEMAGAELVEVVFPGADRIHPTFVAVQGAEALLTHTRAGLYPDRRDQYGRDVRGRLDTATAVTLADYVAATIERERLRAVAASLFAQVDVLLTPISAASPLAFGEEHMLHHGERLDLRRMVMPYTVLQDLVGIPACAVRAGFDGLGIPIGVQFSARRWDDATALAAAHAFGAATPELQSSWPLTP